MADEVREEGTPLTSGELAAFLSNIPEGTQVWLDSTQQFDAISGAIYFKNENAVSLVGSRTFVELAEEDEEGVEIFGDVGLADPSGDTDDDDIPPGQEGVQGPPDDSDPPWGDEDIPGDDAPRDDKGHGEQDVVLRLL